MFCRMNLAIWRDKILVFFLQVFTINLCKNENFLLLIHHWLSFLTVSSFTTVNKSTSTKNTAQLGIPSTLKL